MYALTSAASAASTRMADASARSRSFSCHASGCPIAASG
jgi:hypothetical protein